MLIQEIIISKLRISHRAWKACLTCVSFYWRKLKFKMKWWDFRFSQLWSWSCFLLESDAA